MIEVDPELVRPKSNVETASRLISDLSGLYRSFVFNGAALDTNHLINFAETSLDFRQGRPREDTPWNEGLPLSQEQKIATLEVASQWKMLQDCEPSRPFDITVVLGAHRPTLEIRTQYARGVRAKYNPDSEIIVLSCFRPLHSKEGVDNYQTKTEVDLATSLLEASLGDNFEQETVSSWNDLPYDTEQEAGENAVALIGKIGLTEAVILSGSKPSNSLRASTLSTLETLRSYFEESRPRLLFITTSLHLPYQALQIERVMQGFQHEVVGTAYPSLKNLSVDSSDLEFRIVLQEIGATVKNGLKEKI